jgi:hypothetical protein
MPECYIRGSTIKYLRIPDEVIDNYKEDNSNRGSNMNRRGGDKYNNAHISYSFVCFNELKFHFK